MYCVYGYGSWCDDIHFSSSPSPLHMPIRNRTNQVSIPHLYIYTPVPIRVLFLYTGRGTVTMLFSFFYSFPLLFSFFFLIVPHLHRFVLDPCYCYIRHKDKDICMLQKDIYTILRYGIWFFILAHVSANSNSILSLLLMFLTVKIKEEWKKRKR